MSRLIIIGAGGHGKVVAETAILMKCWDEIVFADDRFPDLASIGAWPVVSDIAKLKSNSGGYHDFIVAIGTNKIRLKIQKSLIEYNLVPVSVIHPSATISPTASIGIGTAIFANVVINANTSIGDACIINTAASVDHDCNLSDGVHISPGAHLAGEVSVGKASWLGIGSSVIQCINIGQDVIVGAGAAAVSDIPNGVVAKGVPARF